MMSDCRASVRTPEAGWVLERAKEEAAELGSQRVAPEHVLLALLRSDEARVARVFGEMHLTHADVRAAIGRLGGPPLVPMTPTGAAGHWSSAAREIMERADQLAGRQQSRELRPEHLLQALDPAKGRLPAILEALTPRMEPHDFASAVDQVLAETEHDR